MKVEVEVERRRGMNYDEWEGSVPGEITGDSLWKMEAYRLGLFVADVGWHDVTNVNRETLDTLLQSVPLP